MRTIHGMICGLALMSCGTSGVDSDRIEVDSNELGVVALEVQRFDDNGDKVFEVRGFDANDREVASVRRRIGHIAEFRPVEGLDSTGSEITLTAGDSAARWLTREVRRYRLPNTDPTLQTFVTIPEVTKALADGNIAVNPPVLPDGEAPYDHTLYQTHTCRSDQIMTTPIGKQCCNDDAFMVVFINPSNAFVAREQGVWPPIANGCRPQNFVGTCSGTSCYWGPNGFSVPSVSPPPPGYPYPKTIRVLEPLEPSGSRAYCGTKFYATQQSALFGTVTGTQPRGGNCCLDGSGPCNLPNRPACSACGGGGSGGYWDDPL